jgi:hypothetical protein
MASDILYHFQYEIVEATNACHENILTLRELQRLVVTRDVCRLKDDGTGGQVITVDDEGLDKLLKIMKEERAQRGSKPERQVFANTDYTLTEIPGFASTHRPFFSPAVPGHTLGKRPRNA